MILSRTTTIFTKESLIFVRELISCSRLLSSATVKADAVLGQATVYLDGYEVGTVDLVTHQEYVSDFRTDLKSTLLLMAALVLLLAVLSCVTLVSGGSSLNRNRRRRANRK